jgi:uncharacterized protein (DUF1800 family)
MNRLPLLALAAGVLLVSPARAAEYDQRLSNLSTRAQVGTGGNVALVGFVIGPGAAKNVLIRAVGPALSAFNVTDRLNDPKIDVFDANGTKILSNDNWSATVAPAGTATTDTFKSVGAFGLSAGSRDAALVATLAPGSYTAQVSGVADATGIALVEVYDVTGSARLLNLSSRARVGTGAGILISGLTLAPGGGPRTILVRAAGPALTQFNVGDVLADPAIAVLDANGTQITSNDNWDSADAATLSAACAKAGAFPFAPGSKDAAVLVDLPSDARYTIQVSGVGATTGNALVEVYDLTPENRTTVNVSATRATTDTKGAAPGLVTFTRTGHTDAALAVSYTLGGSAINGSDYDRLSGQLTFPAGASTAAVSVSALTANAATSINKDVTVRLSPGAGYDVGTASAATVTIFYNPGTLYIASLRAPGSAAASTAFGTATVQLSADNSFAIVNLAFSNLSSPETAVYLRLGTTADVGEGVLRLPTGQVSGMPWKFTGSGTYTAADLVDALKRGNIFVDVETAAYPGGELRGAFIQSSGSSTFIPPPAPPALSTAALSAAEASRFLAQTTFGPTKAEIDALTGKSTADLRAWIDAQEALPATSHLAATDDDFKTFATGTNPQYSQQNRQAAWWKVNVSAPDQLRQRVAFALSELFVVSDANTTLSGTPRGLANYYDLLARGAFGNFRDLLEQVTLSPVMGTYLSSLRNSKPTYDRNGQLLTSPDENYAREVMQLFTIGLSQLQPDGTLKLDALGLPIPTYDQKTITETARVLTGWSFNADTSVASNFRGAKADFLSPMVLYPTFHDTGAKTIVGGVQIPANQSGAKDLKDLLDALFNHPNTGPFVARRLIQRLVTSNPSPGYVYRVAQVFADNGSGVRGDLGAVIRAILMDYEARSSAVAGNASFGKLKEPLIRVTALLRAFNGAANNGRYPYTFPENQTKQAALRSPTVFNFFEPDYVEPGLLASSGLYAPEFQIVDDYSAISVPNLLWNVIYANRSATNPADATIGIQLDSLIPLAGDPSALVEATNLILAGGQISQTITDRIAAAINAMPPTDVMSNSVERVRSAIYLTVTVPQGAVQK